jgi:hypothetical protein
MASSSFCFSSYSSFKASERHRAFDGILDGTFQLGLVSSIEFIGEFLVVEGVTEVISVRFKRVL